MLEKETLKPISLLSKSQNKVKQNYTLYIKYIYNIVDASAHCGVHERRNPGVRLPEISVI